MKKPTYNRQSIRLKEYDYTQSGAYFVTICTHKQTALFGSVGESTVELNQLGQIAYDEWAKSSEIRQEIEIDAFVVMPNHLHGVVFIHKNQKAQQSAKARSRAPLNRAPQSLGAFIAGYKSTVTAQINRLRNSPGTPVWQRNYYEHVIRTQRALDAIREYIAHNPLRWQLDRYNPEANEKDPNATKLWALLQQDNVELKGRTAVRPYDNKNKH